VLWRTEQFLVARKTESVIATNHELSAGVSSKDPVRNGRNFSVAVADRTEGQRDGRTDGQPAAT